MNYNDKINEELDELSADRFGRLESPHHTNWYVAHDSYGKPRLNVHGALWSPTDPTSNQVNRYLIPKIIEKNLMFDLMECSNIGNPRGISVKDVIQKVVSKFVLLSNRDKVISCLMALDCGDERETRNKGTD